MSDTGELHGYVGGVWVSLYKPAGGRRGTAVIVPSIGDERRSLVRAEVDTARHLASMGLETIRFDFSGDGDSGGTRSMAALIRDMGGILRLCEDPVTVVTYRAGLAVFMKYLSTMDDTMAADVFAIAPVTGEDFVRDVRRRANVRDMLTGGDTGDDEGGAMDFAGDIYTEEFLSEFSSPPAAGKIKGRFLAVETGPWKTPRKSTLMMAEAFFKAGAVPADKPPGLIDGGGEGIIIWRHPVIWGEVEHSDIRPLLQALEYFIAGKD